MRDIALNAICQNSLPDFFCLIFLPDFFCQFSVQLGSVNHTVWSERTKSVVTCWIPSFGERSMCIVLFIFLDVSLLIVFFLALRPVLMFGTHFRFVMCKCFPPVRWNIPRKFRMDCAPSTTSPWLLISTIFHFLKQISPLSLSIQSDGHSVCSHCRG